MGTFVIGTLVFGLIGWAAYATFVKKEKGGCGCGCSGCGLEDTCHQEPER